MGDRLRYVRLQGNKHRAIREVAKNTADEHRVLRRTNPETMHKHDGLSCLVR
jgi:hypothetical protein